jgi:hypothetical protein
MRPATIRTLALFVSLLIAPILSAQESTNPEIDFSRPNESRSSRDWRFWGLILSNSLWFAKPADLVELAPSFFEAIQEQLGLKLGQPRLQ